MRPSLQKWVQVGVWYPMSYQENSVGVGPPSFLRVGQTQWHLIYAGWSFYSIVRFFLGSGERGQFAGVCQARMPAGSLDPIRADPGAMSRATLALGSLGGRVNRVTVHTSWPFLITFLGIH